jgi:nidogen-like
MGRRQLGTFRLLLLPAILLLPRLPAFPQAIRDLPGFRAHALPRNDDGSTGAVSMGFDVNFFGRNYNTLFVNNNGNVTFQGPLQVYIPFGLTHTDVPIIAAFFADVDTRAPRSRQVTYGTDRIDQHAAFGVDFFDVGYYNEHDDHLNTFQLILIERADTGPGNFDIEFNYAQIRWDLGDAGRGGNVGPVVGFSNGTAETNAVFELQGSMSASAFLDDGILSLVSHRLNSNIPGRYVFQARNGVIQTPSQAAFTPFLMEPQQATINTPLRLVAGVRMNEGDKLPSNISLRASYQGNEVILHDDGLDGDAVAGDGQFTGRAVFTETGDVPVTIQAIAGNSHSTGEGSVKVWGRYVDGGGPILVNFGHIKAGMKSCKPLLLAGEQQGTVLFQFNLLKTLPREHNLSLQSGPAVYSPGSASLAIPPKAGKEICLVSNRNAPSSEATGQPWVELVMETAQGKQPVATVLLQWKVEALSFWERWGWLILALCIILLVVFIVYGYIRPHRFPRDLALTFVPDYGDLDTSPQPLSQWRGVGIGFYRDATAYLHPDFRVSGRSRGALGVIRATKDGLWVSPAGGSLSREVDLQQWEEITLAGYSARAGLIYRFGERGPYFRIASGARRQHAH